jgi:alkyl sulfatase BDS1-like metallo-beta-lactamase superfamily hydrolase
VRDPIIWAHYLNETIVLENGVLNHLPRFAARPEATMTLTRATLERVQQREVTLEDAVEAGDIKVNGREEAIGELFGMLRHLNWFYIVTPYTREI